MGSSLNINGQRSPAVPLDAEREQRCAETVLDMEANMWKEKGELTHQGLDNKLSSSIPGCLNWGFIKGALCGDIWQARGWNLDFGGKTPPLWC